MSVLNLNWRLEKTKVDKPGYQFLGSLDRLMTKKNYSEDGEMFIYTYNVLIIIYVLQAEKCVTAECGKYLPDWKLIYFF